MNIKNLAKKNRTQDLSDKLDLFDILRYQNLLNCCT